VSFIGAFTNFLKIVFLIMLIVVILLGGIYWFDRIGLIDYRKMVGPFEKFLPSFMRRGEVIEEDPLLLEKEILGKREEVLDAKSEELGVLLKEIEQKEFELKEYEARLQEEARRLEEEKKLLSEKLSQYDNYRENIREQAGYFTSMPPQAAVERLAQMDDLLVIDILRQIDREAEETGTLSLVPYYLSLMDPKKAASIQRKMTKTGGLEK